LGARSGFDQDSLSATSVALVGCGGFGGELGEGLARKGVGNLYLFDGDVVELSNLNRQRFFREDLYRNKAICAARNLATECSGGTTVQGFAASFQDIAESHRMPQADLVVCGVDNNETRVYCARYALNRSLPVVLLGTDETADFGYVFVQTPQQACFGCLFPHAVAEQAADPAPCAKVAAVKDILKALAGIALYAVDSLLMSRKRNWNYRQISLSAALPDVSKTIQKRPNCKLCGRSEED